ncbi:MAG TPA: hypothetical protein VFX12_08895 [Vicinamibacterales bacterium]|nr:hypothetical protein [Vicinamibacterales bacterium]
MMEALAAAAILGGINTLADYAMIAFELQARPLYALGRAVLIGYCIGGLVGARARQLMIGTMSGLLIGLLVGAVYVLLAPALGAGALGVGLALFWIGFALLEMLLAGTSRVENAVLRGALAAIVSGVVFYALNAVWPERSMKDPSLARLMLVWAGAFFPGFVLLFWSRL